MRRPTSGPNEFMASLQGFLHRPIQSKPFTILGTTQNRGTFNQTSNLIDRNSSLVFLQVQGREVELASGEHERKEL